MTTTGGPRAFEPPAATPIAGNGAEPTVHRGRVMAVVCLALVLVVSGVSMLYVALPTITRSLGASQTDQQWIVDGYTVALAALLLFAGALGDRFGRRRALVVGIVIFGVANAFSALAHSAGPLIGWRILAGVGAALIMPATLSTITSVFPPDRRAAAVGVWAGFAGAGTMIGLLLAGAMLEQWWWGSIFVATAAIAGVALVATLAVVPETRSTRVVRLDPPGALLSTAAVGGVVFGIIEGPSRGWTDPVTLLAIAGGVLAGLVFVWRELRSPAPLLDPRFFRIRGFATGSASLFLEFFALFGLFFIALQFLQLVLGYGTFKAALALMPAVVVMLPLATVSGTLGERFGQRIVGAIGLSVMAVAFGVIAAMGDSSGYDVFVVGLVLAAAGMALAMTPATDAIVSSLPGAKQGVASAVNDTARELGAAFGIAILGSAFNSGYRNAIAGSLHGLASPAAATARDAPGAAFTIAQHAGSAGHALADATRHAFMTGSRIAMLIGVGLLLVGAVYVAWHGNGPIAELPEADGEAEPEPAAAAAARGGLA